MKHQCASMMILTCTHPAHRHYTEASSRRKCASDAQVGWALFIQQRKHSSRNQLMTKNRDGIMNMLFSLLRFNLDHDVQLSLKGMDRLIPSPEDASLCCFRYSAKLRSARPGLDLHCPLMCPRKVEGPLRNKDRKVLVCQTHMTVWLCDLLFARGLHKGRVTAV